MKILQVINSIHPQGGGPVESVRQLGSTLNAMGHEVEIVSLDNPSSKHVAEFPLPVYALGPGQAKYAFNARCVPWLRANHGNYDVVIVNGLWQFHSFAVWL